MICYLVFLWVGARQRVWGVVEPSVILKIVFLTCFKIPVFVFLFFLSFRLLKFAVVSVSLPLASFSVFANYASNIVTQIVTGEVCSCCGANGQAVAYEVRGMQFEYRPHFCVYCIPLRRLVQTS